jgi:hypothetical protein
LKKLFLITAMASALTIFASAAEAGPILINFTISGGWFQTIGSTGPYGLSSNPILSGNVTVDGISTNVSAFQALNFQTGTKIWTLTDIQTATNKGIDSVVYGPGNTVTSFGFYIGNDYVFSNNTAGFRQGENGIACNGCVSITSTVATDVPEPATWAMFGLGLLGAGAVARGARRKDARSAI